MLCNRCYKNIPQSKEVKLKDKDSVVCNKCAIRIQKEYHGERYKKYLNGEISYDELDPEGERSISAEFLEIPCRHCWESIAGNSEEEIAISEAVVWDECKGKKCPDCGKIRKLAHVEMKVFKDGYLGFFSICPRCQKKTGSEINGVCGDCFWESEEKKGCICIVSKFNLSRKYYCFLCEKIHILDFRCAKCANLIKEEATVPLGKRLVRPWKLIVPSFFGGVIIGVVIGFIFTRRFKRSRKPRR